VSNTHKVMIAFIVVAEISLQFHRNLLQVVDKSLFFLDFKVFSS
jgi:hypothetical protein